MIITDKTKEIAQGIVDYIIEHPEQHRQETWVGVPAHDDPEDFIDAGPSSVDSMNICSTTMCIAGTAVLIGEGGFDGLKEFIAADNSFYDYGVQALGLNDSEGEDLFYCMSETRAFNAVLSLANGDEDKFREALRV